MSPYDPENDLTRPQWSSPYVAPPPPPSPRPTARPLAWGYGALALCVVLLVALIGHIASGRWLWQAGAVASTTTQVTGTHTVPTATHGPTATTTIPSATASPVAPSCAALGFAGAAASTGNTSFPFAFLPHSVSQPNGSVVEVQGFQQQALAVCTPDEAAATLPSDLGNALTSSGWATYAPQAGDNTGCPPLCWQTTLHTSDFTNGTKLFAGVDGVATHGSTSTYTVHLSIAPLFNGSAVITPDELISLVQNGPTDLHFLTLHSFVLVVNALYAPFPTPTTLDAATCTGISALPLTSPHDPTTHQRQPIILQVGSPVALQGNRDDFAKAVLNYTGGQTVLSWVTYPFCFV